MDINLVRNNIIVPHIYEATHVTNKKDDINSQKKKNEDQISTSSSSKFDYEKTHIQQLLRKLPELGRIFDVHRKIGEGTFSSVFLGSLKCHGHLDEPQRKLFAIKHLVPTSHPSRVEQELKCLKDIGGRDNIIGVDLCLRHYDTIVFIMPYIPHRKFSEYVLDMDVSETRRYIRALLQALRRVHEFGVIHRDVKPSNFLYDRENQRYLLVDFGLAQYIGPASQRSRQALPHDAPRLPAAAKTEPAHAGTNAQEVRVPDGDRSANGRKRKRDSFELEISNGLVVEHSMKRMAVQNGSVALAPLKLLQGDHPKVSPQKYPTPHSHLLTSPKMMSARRKVFLDEIENTTKSSNAASYLHTPHLPQQNGDNPRISNSGVRNGIPDAVQDSPLDYSLKRDNNSNINVISSYNSLNYGVQSPLNLSRNRSVYKTSVQRGLHPNAVSVSGNKHVNGAYNQSHVEVSGSSSVQRGLNPGLVPKSGPKYANGAFNPSQVEVSGSSRVSGRGSSTGGRPAGGCQCHGRAMVCSACLVRPSNNAPRAGTQGFRPPEVLLKYRHQTTAVDMWACGVILLSVLSGRYPFFRAPDDAAALAEFMSLFGSRRVTEIATLLNRQLLCSHDKKQMDLRKLCARLRSRALASRGAGPGAVGARAGGGPPCWDCRLPPAECICYRANEKTDCEQMSWSGFPEAAFDLLLKLLDLNPHTRISAAEALKHPFLAEM